MDDLEREAGELTFTLSDDEEAEPLIGAVSKALEGIEDRPILPREIEDNGARSRSRTGRSASIRGS